MYVKFSQLISNHFEFSTVGILCQGIRDISKSGQRMYFSLEFWQVSTLALESEHVICPLLPLFPVSPTGNNWNDVRLSMCPSMDVYVYIQKE